MRRPVLHQCIAGAAPGDAITDQALLIQRWLHQAGIRSDLFAESVHPLLENKVRSVVHLRREEARSGLLYHHAIGTDIAQRLCEWQVPIFMVYHNITPPDFVRTFDPRLAAQLERGMAQLHTLREHTVLAVADSPYNERELRDLGYARTGVLPIVLHPETYDQPLNPTLAQRLRERGPNILFVGRLVPNKRQDDLIKLLWFYKRIRPDARLLLVGSSWLPSYSQWLRGLAIDLGLGESVWFTEHVPYRDLVTFYRSADIYVSMSEHEGFGKPFIECMYCGLPIVAYAAAAVPDTVGEAGILFTRKNFEAIAELVDLIVHEQTVRQRLIHNGYRRVAQMLEPAVRETFMAYLQHFLQV
nr:glycosyltransferase [Ardenticatena sp.]